MEKLPIEYHLEVYETSFRNDPSVSMMSDSQFPAISVGDYYNHRLTSNWDYPPKPDEAFQVNRIEHIIWENEGHHIGHKLMVCLVKVPHPES